MKNLVITGILLGMVSATFSQVTINPTFPGQSDSITVTYDASQGNAALKDLGPPIVYMHAGVITDKSTSSADWKYVQGNWGTADTKVVMTSMGNNIYQKKYHIRNFYGVPTGETIQRLAFVFRNVDGSKVGRAKDGSDIFVDINQSGFALKRIAPVETDQLITINQYIDIQAESNQSADFTLYVDNNQVTQETGTTSFSYLYQATTPGNHTVRISANNGSETVDDTFYYVVSPNRSLINPATSLPDGVEKLDANTMRVTLYAPNKNTVYLIGDFNNWRYDTAYLMNKTTDGNRYWLDLKGLTTGQEYGYQFVVDGKKVADPFSTTVLDPWNDAWIPSSTYPNLKAYPEGKTTGMVSVFTAFPTAYNWEIETFIPPAREDLVIYELHLRDFIAAHDFQTLEDSLDYLERLGINAIELMPVSEFEGNESWGYNVSFHMALDKYYGTKDALKSLVEACHKRGIAVILDVVYNHAFSQSPLCQLYWDDANFRPSANSPYANQTARHPFNVGYDLNHESDATKAWLDRVNRYWIEEFKVDGFRFDLSKGFTQKNTGSDVGAWGQYDGSRVALLKRMSDAIRSYDNDAILILEHFSEDFEEKELGSYGFLIWRNMNHHYNEASMGYANDLGWAAYNSSGHNKPDWVVYMESHDEERLMYKNVNYGNVNGSYSIKKTATALDRMELTSCFFMGIPGPKMIWQFGELGYDVSIETNGRTGNKPIRWNYQTQSDRADLYQVMSELIHLKTNYKAFKTTNFTQYVSGFGKIIQLNDSDMDVLILGNFDVSLMDLDPNFQHTGKWYEYFSGDSLDVTNTRATMAFLPGEYRIYTTKRIDRPGTSHIGVKPIQRNWRLTLAPNPSQSEFFLTTNETPLTDVSVTIYDQTGKSMPFEREDLTSGSGITIRHQLTSGIYLVMVSDQSGNQQVLRLMVQ